MSKLEYLQTFEIGHPEIDADHRGIVEHINRVYDAISEADMAACKDLFDGFIFLTRRHFAKEEAILRNSGFPRAAEHAEYHAALLERTEAVKALCRESTDPAHLSGCFDELVQFVVDDIIKGDSDFVSHLEETGFIRRS